MDRETALLVLAEDVLSDRDYCRDRDLVSDFVKGILNQDWQALQERLNEPLTEAQVTHVTKRTLGVMCDLVLSLVPTLLSHQQLQAQSRSGHLSKSVRFASPFDYDTEFLETSAEEVMGIVTSSYDLIQASSKKESDAGKVLQALASKVSSFTNPTDEASSSVLESESGFTYDAQDDCCAYFDWKFWLCTHKIKSSLKRGKKGHSLTVCPQKVTTELSNEEFQKGCRDELERFLLRNPTGLPDDSEAQVSTDRVTAVACELLDAVINSVHQLCEPNSARKIEVSEDNLLEKALNLKYNIHNILQRFLSKTELLPDRGSRDELMSSLEDVEILSKSMLTLFATLLTEKICTKYYLQDEHEQKELPPSCKPCSFPEVNTPDGEDTEILPSKQACAFVTEAMTFLLKTLCFPPPNSESVNSGCKATLLPCEAINKSYALLADPELEESERLDQLIIRLQNLQPELF